MMTGKQRRQAHAALKRAIEAVESQSELARRLGTKQNVVNGWLKRGLPSGRVLEVEAVTGVGRYDLRPDYYPPPRPSR